MGYLEANRFGYAIAGSHSSRTAEGDNSVLMNKVASELIQKIDKKTIPQIIGHFFLHKLLDGFLPFYSSNSMNKIDIDGLIGNMETFKNRSMAHLALKMVKQY